MSYLKELNHNAMVSMVKSKLNALAAKLLPQRMWIQSFFLLVWLDPFAARLHTICGPVFHCHSCPLALFACPVGVIAQFSSLHLFPFFAVGILVLTGALLGSLLCGWACPFGFIQDLAAKVPLPKFNLPKWSGYLRYAVLIGTVLLIPYFLGQDNPLFICRVCPAGGLESAVPMMAQQVLAGDSVSWINQIKLAVIIAFLLAVFFIRRPWCRLLCPLGAVLAIFNRLSLICLRLSKDKCTVCGRCHKLCEYGIDPEKTPNDLTCIRCLECTRCRTGALTVGTSLMRNSA